MTIETKYNIGDEVWVNHFGGSCVRATVKRIKISIPAISCKQIRYLVQLYNENPHVTYCHYEDEADIFPTKEEFRKRL